MLYGVMIILMAWFIEMPLWLSIVMTVVAGIDILWNLFD